jgi:hypothetical protein
MKANRNHRYLVVDGDLRPLGFLHDKAATIESRVFGDRVIFPADEPLSAVFEPSYLNDPVISSPQIRMSIERYSSRRDDLRHDCVVLRVIQGRDHLGDLARFEWLSEAMGNASRVVNETAMKVA